MSILPSFAIASSARRLTSSSLALSAAVQSALMARPARCFWACSRSAALRDDKTIFAPCSPRASAICRPSPRDPPVISADFPPRSNAFFMLPMPCSSDRIGLPACAGFRIASVAAKHRCAALDERLDALFGILAVEDTRLDLWNVVDGRPLAAFDVFQCGFLGDLNTQRSVPGNELPDFHGPFDLLAWCDDFLNEADFVGALCVELVAQQQMIHGITPAGARQESEMSAAQRSDAALGLHLAE